MDLQGVGNHKRHTDNAGFFKELYSEIHNTYDQSNSRVSPALISRLSLTIFILEMKAYKNIYDSTNIHVALCDHFTVPCIDMTKNVKVPLVITTALAISKGARKKAANMTSQ